MTETNHTLGPWKVCRNMDGDLSVGTDEVDPWFIAEMCLGAEGDDRPDDPADANARLIAAAPDMLEALEELVAQILDYERVNNLAPSPGRKYCWDATERAVAAIAKATGG